MVAILCNNSCSSATTSDDLEVPSMLFLDRDDVRRLLDLEACIDAVEAALRAHAAGATIPPGVLSAAVPGGVFHIKTAGLLGDRPLFVTKVNGNFEHNAARGLARIQGVIVACDAVDGRPLAVLDTGEVTVTRTGAS